MKRLSLIALILVASSLNADAGDWRQFRGNLGNSVAEGENLPTN